jgi:hypothetical protein
MISIQQEQRLQDFLDGLLISNLRSELENMRQESAAYFPVNQARPERL